VALDVDAHLGELVDQILVRYAKLFGDLIHTRVAQPDSPIYS